MKAKVFLLFLIAGFWALFSCINPIIEELYRTPTTITPEKNAYKVTFNSNGGSEVETQTIDEGKTATRPQNPSRSGFGFVNWHNCEELSEPHYDFDTPINGDITLYAKWNAIFYTVIFDSNGGSEVEDQEVGENGTASRPVPTKEGYTFDDWYSDPELTVLYDFDTPITGDFTLYAKWTLKTYTVTFMDGEAVLDELTKTVTHGSTISRPATDPTKEGYDFDDWYSDSKLTAVYDFDTPVTGGFTLYAKWTLKTYTVTFMDGEAVLAELTKTVTHGNTVSRPEDPTKEEHTFDDWYSDPELTAVYDFDTPVTDDIDLCAKWEIVNITSTKDYEMVWINPGTYTRGSPTDEPGRIGSPTGRERQHQVTLTQGFFMGKYPVTQAQYEAVMGTNPSNFKTPVPLETSTANRPVEMVSWYDAIVFCNKLSALEGLSPVYRINGSTNPAEWGDVPADYVNPFGPLKSWDAVEIVANATGYRLPTEAQWEYACRAGTTTAYNTGATLSDNTGWYWDNGDSRTHSVGEKAANAWGLYDMHGNVFEWCWDWSASYASTALQTDPVRNDQQTTRVARGGSWRSGDWEIRSAFREFGDSFDYPYFRRNYLGFRLVRQLAPVVTIDDEDFPGQTIHNTFNVSTTAEWENTAYAIKNGGNNKNYIINVIADFNVAGEPFSKFGSASGIKVSFRGAGRILTLTGTGRILWVESGQTFILRDLILWGSKNLGPLVHVEGTFIMQSGKICKNNSGDYAGGVDLDYGGSFTMNGGEISDNIATSGGGVYVFDGTFTMNGGIIFGNSAMNGGGVNVLGGYGASFTMNGGKISGNTATFSGGGVCVSNDSFTMYGGEISGNTSSASNSPNGGGGVYVSGGTFRIVTGTIYGFDAGDTSLMNYADTSGAALLKNGGTAQYGKFNGTTWLKTDDLQTTNNTIKVKDGNPQ